MAPITDLMKRYLSAPDEIDNILSLGADAADEIATPIVAEVRDIMGFWKVK